MVSSRSKEDGSTRIVILHNKIHLMRQIPLLCMQRARPMVRSFSSSWKTDCVARGSRADVIMTSFSQSNRSIFSSHKWKSSFCVASVSHGVRFRATFVPSKILLEPLVDLSSLRLEYETNYILASCLLLLLQVRRSSEADTIFSRLAASTKT